MISIEIILLVLVSVLISLYVAFKLKSGKGLAEIFKDANKDIKQVKHSVQEAKSLLTDDLAQKTLRSFMVEVENENQTQQKNC